MLKAISQIDLFGKPVLFNYKGNSKSKSKIGAVFTIVLFAFIIWITVYFGQQLFDTTNPKASSFESFNENPAATPLNTDTFAFGIAMTNSFTYANFINESIYKISASTYKTTRVPQPDGSVQVIYEIVPLELEQCTPDHFGELSESFSYVGLDQLYCLKKGQPGLNNGSPILEGNFESPVFQNVLFELSECDRNTSTTCGTQEEIDALLKAGMLSLSFSNVAIDLTDSKKPLKKFRDGWYTTVGSGYYKEINLYLDQVEINTDHGWLTSDFKTESYAKYGEIKEIFSLTKKSSYANFILRVSNVKKHFNRSYTKIQDIIAQVNGTIAVTFTILFLVLAPYVRLKFYETLINDIFDIKIPKKDEKGNNPPRKVKQNRKNSKTKEHKNKPALTVTKEVFSSQEDLELQSPTSQHNTKHTLMNKTEFREGKYTDDINLLKKGATLEESSLKKHNFTEIMQQRPSSQIAKPDAYLKDIENNEAKYNSRDVSRIPLNFSGVQSENANGINFDLTIPVLSPNARKPSFSKPHFKIVDYEGHEEDVFEDILNNIDLDKKREDNNPAVDFEISQIRSEEKEKEDCDDPQAQKMTRDHKEVMSQMLRSDGDEEEERDKNEKVSKSISLQKLELITAKNADEINLSFGEYLRSFFTRSEVIKEKISVLNEGISRINERLDIFNVFKKLREFDKLKVLLLENEQFVLFHSLPRPELKLKVKDASHNPNVHSPSNIKDPQFIQEKLKKDLILLSYQHLKGKQTSTMMDKKLLEIYNDILMKP